MPDATRSFYRAADVRLRGLVALIRSDPRAQAFAETELRGVLAHRAKHGDDMFDLLRAYLDADGNKTELAARLHLSRPTLYARLAALQRLLGVDLAVRGHADPAEVTTRCLARRLTYRVNPVGA
jgi:purine catabolism regulator